MRAKRYSTSVLMLRSATAWMLPPRPPSPPSGPPRGMNFSRLNEAMPSPPLPAWTSMVASSTNFMEVQYHHRDTEKCKKRKYARETSTDRLPEDGRRSQPATCIGKTILSLLSVPLCLCGKSVVQKTKALPGPIGLLAESGKPYAGVTLTTFLLTGPFTAKVTLPSILANRV